MKQFITLLLIMVAFATQSFAVKAVVTAEVTDETTMTADYGQEDGLVFKAQKFVAKKINQIKKAFGSDEERDILMLILIWVFPPAAMYIYEGKQWTKRVTLNLILSILCWLPGAIHAAVTIFGKK